MAWPRKIAKFGLGSGRLVPSAVPPDLLRKFSKDSAKERKRAFMQKAVLVLLDNMDLVDEDSRAPKALVTIAEQLYNNIEKVLDDRRDQD